jgi:putative FmdB family regulatory protein
MPTYEYQCKTCGAVFDVFQSIKASPLKNTHCETCGASRPVRRLIGTGGAVLFKGSGFYQTDYRSKSYQDKAKAESGGGDSAKKDTPAKDSTPSAPKSSKEGNASPSPKPDSKKAT